MSDASDPKLLFGFSQLASSTSVESNLIPTISTANSTSITIFDGAYSILPFRLNSAVNGVDLTTELTFFTKTDDVSATANSTASRHEYFFSVWSPISDSSGSLRVSSEFAKGVLSLIEVTSQIYRDALGACKEILNQVDLDDADARDEGVRLLKVTLKPFHSVLETVFSGLLEWRIAEPVAVSFLLVEVLPSLKALRAETKITIIRTVLEQSRPSIRFAAIRALDQLGGSMAHQLMSHMYPTEPGRLSRDLIINSLAGSSNGKPNPLP